MSMIFINCAMQPCGSIFKASGSHFIAYYESISKYLCIRMSCILVLCLKKSFASTIFSVSLMLPHGLYRLSQICNDFLEHEFEPPPPSPFAKCQNRMQYWGRQASHTVGHFESNIELAFLLVKKMTDGETQYYYIKVNWLGQIIFWIKYSKHWHYKEHVFRPKEFLQRSWIKDDIARSLMDNSEYSWPGNWNRPQFSDMNQKSKSIKSKCSQMFYSYFQIRVDKRSPHCNNKEKVKILI